MKRNKYFLGSTIAICLIIVVSCSKNKVDAPVVSITLDLPDQMFSYNATSDALGTLGRVIFYDRVISINNAISCGSCHKQVIAFSDNTPVSPGFENVMGGRNTPPIQNLSNFSDQVLFWDGRETQLISMVTKPVFNHVELGLRTSSELVQKIAARSYYTDLFMEAYGDSEVNFGRISEALSGFVASIVSFNSKFDMMVLFGVGDLSTQEQAGMDLFFGKYNCGSCHVLSNPVGYGDPTPTALLNIGLDLNYTDNGMGALNGNPSDDGKFKIPNLRNIDLTGPYMHDGRFSDLRDVLEHYSSGIADHPNLDVRLKDEFGNPKVMNISETDKDLLLTFLHTLTDPVLITDVKFSNPFVTN